MWKEVWETHRGAVVGLSLGVFLGFIYLVCGFWDMLVFGIIVLVGLYFGRRWDKQEPLFGQIAVFYRWMMDRWLPFR